MEKVVSDAVNAIRILSAESIQQANSGHPGLPMGAAPIAYTLWARHMHHNPKDPQWLNRDRFVLSAGHGSMLLYSLLHLFGYGLTKVDLMNFRQLKSKTPGHPEYGHTVGVETSTGPLGQGVANAVGFALAESMLAARYNKEDIRPIDHYTYCLCGDGCMMEGIEYEAASLAGTWGLGKLIVFYDSNGISIEGSTDIAFRDDVARRHEAQGWQVLTVDDGEDIEALDAAIVLAQKCTDKPSLIVVKTVIGYGSPKAGTAACHGAPLGDEGLAASKETFGWTAKPFEVPNDVARHYADCAAECAKAQADWNKVMKAYKAAYPDEYEELMQRKSGKLSRAIAEEKTLWKFKDGDSTRNTSGAILNKLADWLPELVGGSADLAPSNMTYLKNKGDYSKENTAGRNLHFGIREHAMAAITNGLYLHGGFAAFCATFFVFSDYMKNAMRMSALMNIPVTYVLTHDPIGVGEDGPTHQPVEQLVGLRSIPNLKVFRPADGKETAAAYISALTGKQPTAIVCSRQKLPLLSKSGPEALKGGYIVRESEKETPDVILIATGSEVSLCVDAAEALSAQKIDARVVSMPCIEVFEAQPKAYREQILPPEVRARVAVEAGSAYSWFKYVGLDGATVTMDTFGESAPADQLFEIYGFTAENVAKTAAKVYKAYKKSQQQ